MIRFKYGDPQGVPAKISRAKNDQIYCPQEHGILYHQTRSGGYWTDGRKLPEIRPRGFGYSGRQMLDDTLCCETKGD